MLITGVRFNKNFLPQTSKRCAFTRLITVDFFSQVKQLNKLEGFGQNFPLSSPQTRLAVTKWALIMDSLVLV